MKQLKDVRSAGASVLCKLGKLGVRKSAVIGMYRFEIPPKCREGIVDKTHEVWKEKNE